MNDKLKKVLKFIAVTGIVTAGILAVIGNKEIKKHFKDGMEKLNKRLKYKQNGCNDAKSQLLLIAKQINNDIKNTERRTSQNNHNKNHEKYKHLWGDKSSCN